ncbi:TetR/AcrR family transcriptional regulator [Streptomyces mirabilis]
MGHREDLLEGAKRCLLEKGFVRTTARDIVKESGTNLASIGYHYGSKDALLTQAFVELVQEWGEKFAPTRSARTHPGVPWSGSTACGRGCWSPSRSSGPSGRPAWRS